ncbi:MAG: hypothetical protein AAGL89_01140 [Pseudomonadota bacterium]
MFETFLNGLWADRFLIAGTLAAILSMVAFYPYIRDTWRGTTQPDRACWLIWSVLASISGASNLYEGAGASMVFIGAQVLGTLIVFALSITRGSGRFLDHGNVVILGVAGIGLISWAMMDTALYALMLSIGVSALGGLTTASKAYRSPTSETASAWVLLLAASTFGLFSVGSTDPLLLAYPVYLFVLYAGILLAQLAGQAAEAERVEDAARAVRRTIVPPLTSLPVFERATAPVPMQDTSQSARLAA